MESSSEFDEGRYELVDSQEAADLLGVSSIEELFLGYYIDRPRTMQAVWGLLHRDPPVDVVVTGERAQGKSTFLQQVGLQLTKADEHWEGFGMTAHSGSVPFDVVIGSLEPHVSVFILDDLHLVSPEDLAVLEKALDRRPRLRLLGAGPAAETTQLFAAAGVRQPAKVPLEQLSRGEVIDLMQLMGVPPDVAADLEAHSDHNGRMDRAIALATGGLLASTGTEMPTILGPDGQPLSSGSADMEAVELSVKNTSDALIAHFARNPEAMYEMDPRTFEELVAELYEREGFEVELTRASRDGGVDIYAVQRATFGSFLTVVDCKRYAADRPIEVGLVQGLYGTVNDLHASMGVIATTSYFTGGAKRLQERRKHRLGLQDFAAVREMLKRARDGKTP